MKLAIVLFNLGGPDSPEAVEPFLRNLFSDPAIIDLPAIIRLPLARFISKRRAPIAREIYNHLGGKSPIFEETRKQADALAASLSGNGVDAKAFIAMRCWHPFSDGAAQAVKAFGADKIVEQSARAIIQALDMPNIEPVVCYQSKVGRLEWIGPATDAEIMRAGRDGKGVIAVPIAFVSEHSETLVELDIEYRKLAHESGVPDYRRAATVGAHPDFIAGLAGLVRNALNSKTVTCALENGSGRRICSPALARCGFN